MNKFDAHTIQTNTFETEEECKHNYSQNEWNLIVIFLFQIAYGNKNGSFFLCTEEKFLQFFNEDATSRGTLQTFLHEERRTVWSRRHVAKMFW